MVKSMADELNSDASELIRAASIPHTTIPFTPAGNSFDTKVGKAASALCIPLANMGRKPSPPATSDFWCKAKAIMPGIRKRKTGSNLRYAPNIVPRRASFWFFPERTRCTINWSVHQYQKPIIEEPTSAPNHGKLGSRLSRMRSVMESP